MNVLPNASKAVNVCVLLASLSLLMPRSPVQAETIAYRATWSSSFEFQSESEPPDVLGPCRMRGTFLMTRQLSPLDWEVYRITDVRLEAATGEAEPMVLRGGGTFRRGGRFDQSMQMVLDVHLGGTAIRLDSGELPAEAPNSDLDMVLNGSGTGGARPGTYVLRLAAVRELARWHYRLIDGSSLTDDCEMCGRPAIRMPLWGEFEMVLVEENPLFSRYHLFDIRFSSGTGYELKGEGEYQVGGEVVLRQDLRLDVEAKGTFLGSRTMSLTSAAGPPPRLWPMWAVDARETDSPPLSTLILELRAAPSHEIWFSTGTGMTPGAQPGIEPRISGGDVLTDTGRRVKTNAELVSALGWSAAEEPLSIDALTIVPGGEVWYSFSESHVSPTLGRIGDGDLVSDRGRVVRRNADLLGLFGLMPPVPDLGLDGVQVMEDGEILFSIIRESFSERWGVLLRSGDILSNSGRVIRAAKELLAGFQAEDQEIEPGLDAFFVWPSGEVWFSTENGFVSRTVGSIMDGDLLSDQGYVVGRNLDLVQAFQPIEDLANFGLDGLFVVTDAMASPRAPELALSLDPGGGGSVRLKWPGYGRVFQVEGTANLGDPLTARSPILPAIEWVEPLPVPHAQRVLYRLRQW